LHGGIDSYMLASMKINPKKSVLLVLCKCLNAVDLFFYGFFHFIEFPCVCLCVSKIVRFEEAEQDLTCSVCSGVNLLLRYGAVV